jgi:adenylate cyclase
MSTSALLAPLKCRCDKQSGIETIVDRFQETGLNIPKEEMRPMGEETTVRKLTAILAADVVGYSRLMGADETGTISTLGDYRNVFIEQIEKHHGQVVDAKGDAILAEFASVVDAVAGAVEIQRELAERNAALSAERRMDFRIGINTGDVIVKDDVIYGDGVNVAARLESLADPGGICISHYAFDQVERKLPLFYEYMGEHRVKNITRSVRAYRVLTKPGATAHRVAKVKRTLDRLRRNSILAAAFAVILVGAGFAVGFHYFSSTQEATVEGLALPDNPSIAVLPFTNMSGDPDQEYFSDGISETIITDLSKLSNLFVIARNSTFRYKGQAVDVRKVGKELGVRYVLEGSIQKAGDRVRINVQLIDTSTGEHMWAERYDRPYDDLFALQDEITQMIVTELDVNLVEGEQARMWRKISGDIGSYERTMRAVESFRKGTRDANEDGKRIFESVLDEDPENAGAMAGLGWSYLADFRFGWSSDPRQSMERAIDLANRSLAIDDNVAVAHALLGFLRMYEGRHDESLASIRKATAQHPNSSLFSATYANALIYSGKPEEALAAIERAMRLSPFYPSWYLSVLALENHDAGRFEESIAANENLISRPQEGHVDLAYLALSLAYSGLGDEHKAREAAQEVIRLRSDFSLEDLPRFYPYRDPATIERMARTLRSAGLS